MFGYKGYNCSYIACSMSKLVVRISGKVRWKWKQFRENIGFRKDKRLKNNEAFFALMLKIRSLNVAAEQWLVIYTSL